MDRELVVKNKDGEEVSIYVLNTFAVDEYPGKNYIVYTFGETTDDGGIKSYLSVINYKDEMSVIDSIEDKDELNIVEEAYENMLFKSKEEE